MDMDKSDENMGDEAFAYPIEDPEYLRVLAFPPRGLPPLDDNPIMAYAMAVVYAAAMVVILLAP